LCKVLRGLPPPVKLIVWVKFGFVLARRTEGEASLGIVALWKFAALVKFVVG